MKTKLKVGHNTYMGALNFVSRFFVRFRYPFTLPEDIANALGVEISNHLPFNDVVNSLCSPACKPTRLCKFMPRREAEAAFERAQCKEKFGDRTLISFQFPQGWMEFDLRFDKNSRLRRMYLQHRDIENIEIQLNQNFKNSNF